MSGYGHHMNRGDGSDEPAPDPRCVSPPGACATDAPAGIRADPCCHRLGSPGDPSIARDPGGGSRFRRRAVVRNPRGALTNGRSVSADVRTLRPRRAAAPRPRLARRSVQSFRRAFAPPACLINTNFR